MYMGHSLIRHLFLEPLTGTAEILTPATQHQNRFKKCSYTHANCIFPPDSTLPPLARTSPNSLPIQEEILKKSVKIHGYPTTKRSSLQKSPRKHQHKNTRDSCGSHNHIFSAHKKETNGKNSATPTRAGTTNGVKSNGHHPILFRPEQTQALQGLSDQKSSPQPEDGFFRN